jgi:hypothetical protein
MSTVRPPSATTPDHSGAPTAPADPKRRRLLFALGAGGASAAAAAVAAGPGGTPASPENTPAESSSGYRESDHVRHYYRTARI